MALAPRLVRVATIVSKIEDMGIHVIDASVSHFQSPALGTRIAVRGGNAALIAISDMLAEEIIDPIRPRGQVESPLLVTNVLIDGTVVHLSGKGA